MQEKSYDTDRKSQVEICAQPQPTLGSLGSLPTISLPAHSAGPPTLGSLGILVGEAIHPLLADLERFDDDGRPTTMH